MPQRKWARIRLVGAHNLRRGAWYPVVNDSNSSFVILDVSKHNVPVSRESVELSEVKPVLWSIVKFDPSKPIPPRISQQQLPLTYAVCPICRARARVEDDQPEITCVDCNTRSKVDWSSPC